MVYEGGFPEPNSRGAPWMWGRPLNPKILNPAYPESPVSLNEGVYRIPQVMHPETLSPKP